MSSNNGTKANPCIVGDIVGDWREEVILRTTNNRFIRIYMTPTETNYRFHTFLQDPVYRMSIVYQNVAYNQPAHTGFYFGSDLENIFVPEKIEIEDTEYELDPVVDAITYQWSDGTTEKKLLLKQVDYAAGEEHKVWLDMNYHGHVFSDTIAIQFTKLNSIYSIEKTEPVKLLTTLVKNNELSVQFENKGIFDCFVYALNGNLVAKSTWVVGGKSVQTFSVADLPAGQYIINIENKSTSYREKFLKL
jgi:rhamnogalacturonan endolyase